MKGLKVFEVGYPLTGSDRRRMKVFEKDGIQVKQCTQCYLVKPTSDYYRRGKSKSKNMNGRYYSRKPGVFSQCKKCANKRIVAWQILNPEQTKLHKKNAVRRCREKDPLFYRIKDKWYATRRFAENKNYHYCTATIEELISCYSETCECCGRNVGEKIRMDHCHTSGKFRGWLCHNCNIILGLARDEEQTLRNAADYLKKSKERYSDGESKIAGETRTEAAEDNQRPARQVCEGLRGDTRCGRGVKAGGV